MSENAIEIRPIVRMKIGRTFLDGRYRLAQKGIGEFADSGNALYMASSNRQSYERAMNQSLMMTSYLTMEGRRRAV
jgi:hypothetical protein